MRLKLIYIDLLLLLLTINEMPFFSHKIYVLVRYSILIYFLAKYYFYFIGIKKNREKNIAIVLLALFCILSTVSTANYTRDVFWSISAFMNGLNYFIFFVVLYSIACKHGYKTIIHFLYYCILFILIINDLLMLIIKYEFRNPSEQYFIGNKFSVSYIHCFLIAISKTYSIIYNGKNKYYVRFSPFCICIISILVSWFIHCSTGLIISILSSIIICLPQKIKKVIYNRNYVTILLVVENVLIFGSAQLFNNSFVQTFFTQVLHKSSNMTGRFKIYAALDGIIAGSPLFGYGYNTVTDIVTSVVGYGNAQNGIKQLLIEFGIIGTGLLLLSLYMFVGKEDDKEKEPSNLYVVIFALIVASMVEITISSLFVFSIALVSVEGFFYQSKNKDVKNERSNIYCKNV